MAQPTLMSINLYCVFLTFFLHPLPTFSLHSLSYNLPFIIYKISIVPIFTSNLRFNHFGIDMGSNKALNPNAEPYYLQQQKLFCPKLAALTGFPHYYCNFSPTRYHVVNHELGGMRRRGSAKKKKGCHERKKVKAEWRVKEAEGKKKLPETDGRAVRRAVLPFPTTVEEAEVTRTTTVMIRNIPNQLALGDLLRVLDNHCFLPNRDIGATDFSKFDFVYLPMDYRRHTFERRKSNLGYAFANFTTPKAAFEFYKRFNGVMWNVVENRKICEVSAAQYQGKETLLTIFSSKVFVCNNPGFLPVVFLAARNGYNRKSKGTPLGKHVWGLPKKSIGRS